MNAIATISQDIWALEEQFNSVAVDTTIKFSREAEFAIQVASGNEFLAKVALGNRQSLADAVTNISAIGISLNPAKRQAYLVPRKNKVCLDISYLGLIDLAVASGSVRWAQAEVVCKHDEFKITGFGKAPVHVYDPFSPERGDMVGAYVVAKTSDGDFLTATMSMAKLLSIKQRSESGKKGNGPWVTDFEEMAKKSVVKQASKYWPRVERLEKAIHYLNEDADEGIDFAAERAQQAESQPHASRKPTVAMPQARQDTPEDHGVTDVQPKRQAPANDSSNVELASVGEVAWVTKKVRAQQLAPGYACELANIAPREDFAGISKAEFQALKAVL